MKARTLRERVGEVLCCVVRKRSSQKGIFRKHKERWCSSVMVVGWLRLMMKESTWSWMVFECLTEVTRVMGEGGVMEDRRVQSCGSERMGLLWLKVVFPKVKSSFWWLDLSEPLERMRLKEVLT